MSFRNTELRYRAGTPMPTRPAHDTNSATQLAAKMPALMWPAFALRLTPPHWSFRHMSAGLAAAMLLVNSRVSFDEAIGLLGRPLTTQALSHVLKRLQSDPCWNDIRRAIIEVADYLHNHPCPIDYQRRRTLDYTALLPEAAWRDICAAARIICTDTSLHLTQSHLYAVLTGNPIRDAPGYLDNPIFAAAVPAYPARLTPVAAAALQTAAQEFLHRAGIAEPLTWQPPLRLLDGLVLPGADPDTINIAALHHLIEHREPLSTVARQLNSTPEAVRHVLTLHPANVGHTLDNTRPLGPGRHIAAGKVRPPSTARNERRCATSPPATTLTARQSPPSRISTESTPVTSHDCTRRSTATGSTPSTSSTAAPCPIWPPKKA